MAGGGEATTDFTLPRATESANNFLMTIEEMGEQPQAPRKCR
jgi:hypothetical protein